MFKILVINDINELMGGVKLAFQSSIIPIFHLVTLFKYLFIMLKQYILQPKI